MSGEIINPFSSDFKKSSSTFSSQSIPVVAYALIGITSLTLAYVTLIETTQGDITGAKQPSATSMLPSFVTPPSTVQSPSPVPASAQVASPAPMAEAVPIPEEKRSLGGKTKSKGKSKGKGKGKGKGTKRR